MTSTTSNGYDELTLPGFTADIAHARYTDPTTSHQAAASVAPSTLIRSRAVVLEILAGADTGHTQPSIAVIADILASRPMANDWYAVTPSRLRTAVRECVAMGYVVDSGRKRPTATGRNAIVWTITDAGRAALRGHRGAPR